LLRALVRVLQLIGASSGKRADGGPGAVSRVDTTHRDGKGECWAFRGRDVAHRIPGGPTGGE